MNRRSGLYRFFGGLDLFPGKSALEALLFDLEFLLFESEPLIGGGLADPVVPILVDDGAAGLPESAGKFRGAEFKEENKNDEVGQAEDKDSTHGAENGGEELVVQEIADVAPGHLAGGGGGSIEPLGAGKERVGEGRSKDRGGQLEEAGPGDEKHAQQEKLLGVADLLGKKEKKAAGDEDHGKEVGTESEKKKQDAAQVGAGWADQVGFGVLGRLGVKGEIAGIEGKKGEEKKNSGAEDGQGNDFLAEAGAGAGWFLFSHGKRVCLMKRKDGVFQGKFMGARPDLGDNLSPWMRTRSAVEVPVGVGGDDRKGEPGKPWGTGGNTLRALGGKNPVRGVGTEGGLGDGGAERP